MGDKKIVLYHYTSKGDAEAIKKSKVIKASSKDNDDAIFGEGVYFTSIDPSNAPEKILLNNYDDNGFVVNSETLWAKIEWVVEVSLPGVKVKKAKTNRDVYLYGGNVNLNLYQHQVYKNPNI